MRIEKLATKNFDDYDVFVVREELASRWAWPWYKMAEPVERLIKIYHVLEADDETGLIVSQVITPAGNPVYTNGEEDIYIDNTVRLLLLVPPIRQAFLADKYVPKVQILYEKKIRIVNKYPVSTAHRLEPGLNEMVVMQ